LTQVGIRDYSEEEKSFAEENGVYVFYDAMIKQKMFEGSSWQSICDQIISSLPDKVYVSLDIDGLNPSYCPNTGTPVPGGLTFDEVDYLLRKLAFSGKQIVGFDLNEVSPGHNEWDANVGARLLYRLSSYQAYTKGIIKGSVDRT